MNSFQQQMTEYKKLLAKGDLQQAYRGLMDYLRNLRLYFKNKYPDYYVSGDLYLGYMDMTYFSIIPKSLKHRQLKIALVFLHEEFRFEVWLSGSNKKIQAQYWKVITESNWNQYRIVTPGKDIDSIVEYIVVDNPNFSDLEALTQQIEKKTLEFIEDVENFLSEH